MSEQIIKKLTPKQVAKFGDYRKRYIRYGLACGPANRKKVKELMVQIYANAIPKPLTPPKEFIWVKSPMAGTEKALELMGKKKPFKSKDVDHTIDNCGFGQHDVSWLVFYAFFAIECNLDSAKPVMPLVELCKYCGWWWPFDEAVIISDRPTEIHLNKDQKLHNRRGPAILFADGFSVHAINGVVTPRLTSKTKPAKV